MSEYEFVWNYYAPHCTRCQWPFQRHPAQEDRQFCRACESRADDFIKVIFGSVTEE